MVALTDRPSVISQGFEVWVWPTQTRPVRNPTAPSFARKHIQSRNSSLKGLLKGLNGEARFTQADLDPSKLMNHLDVLT